MVPAILDSIGLVRFRLRVRAEITPDHLEQGHWFEFEIGQSCLPATVAQLESVLVAVSAVGNTSRGGRFPPCFPQLLRRRRPVIVERGREEEGVGSPRVARIDGKQVARRPWLIRAERV